jgi:hypothetical protein
MSAVGTSEGRKHAKFCSRRGIDRLTFSTPGCVQHNRVALPNFLQSGQEFLDHFQSSFWTFDMADFTKEWIEHLKAQISGRMNIVADKMDPQSYDELVTDLAWFTFRFARDPDTKMRKVFR